MKSEFFTALFISLLSFSSFAAEEIIKKKYYTLNYNEDHEVANWVAYDLNRDRLKNCVKRQDNFRPDPDVTTGSAEADDYRNSGYDRGHLVPAGDMKFHKDAMSDTFFFSNMTPQPSTFNQGRWSDLENLMRSWASKYSEITIVTGPILKDNLPAIGARNDVSIPEQYFKAVIRKNGNTYEGIAFILKTSAGSRDLSTYVTTIDKVEDLTGFDFFSHLEDGIEEKIERKSDKKNWDFTGKFEYFPCRASVAL